MVDGLDGLATGVVGIGAIAFFVFCYQLTSLNNASLASTGALLSAMLGGACAGFLPHNINPARLFMGDSGSMLIGLVLSASAITLTGQYSGSDLSKGAMGSPASLAPTFLPLALPILLLVVPIADLVLAVIRRTRAGRSPFAPDKQHLHHRLLEIGHSQRRAVLIMWMWAALVAGSTVVISLYTGPLMWSGIGVAAGLTVVLTFLLPEAAAARSGGAREPLTEPERTLSSGPGSACATFHKHPVADQIRPPDMTTDRLVTRFGGAVARCAHADRAPSPRRSSDGAAVIVSERRRGPVERASAISIFWTYTPMRAT